MSRLLSPILPAILPATLLVVGSCSLYMDPDPPPPGRPITGGTLLVTRDGNFAVASDSERDRVVMVDLSTNTLVASVPLEPGDEPGRLVEDGAGRIHVALRRGGAVVTIAGTISGEPAVDRRPVCAAPRGLAWEERRDLLHVACATGELVSLPPAGGAAVRSLVLDRDLRDVVVVGDQLLVTRFRAADALWIAADGSVTSRVQPATITRDGPFGGGDPEQVAVPAVAWRTASWRGNRAVMVHQRAARTPLSIQPGGYGGGGCSSQIESTITIFDPAFPSPGAALAFPFGALPVDISVSPTYDNVAVVMAGDPSVRVVSIASMTTPSTSPCGFVSTEIREPADIGLGRPVAVAHTPAGRLVVQYERGLSVPDETNWTRVVVFADVPDDPGKQRFHQATFTGLACASCHPEGLDDGLAWDFDELGRRRTQNLSGNLRERAPYHWGGDMNTLHKLVDDVLVGRMGSEPLSVGDERALEEFLFNLPPPPAPTGLDAAAVARGRAVFESAEMGCTTCHNGEIYTNNAMADVGTGGRFKVPSLIGVGWRAPYMHTGCAITLRDRFGACGGGASHGATDTLDEAQLGDLITFLESL